MISKQIIDYIIDFVLGPVYHARHEASNVCPGADETEHTTSPSNRRRRAHIIRYTDKVDEMRGAAVVIRPSGFFDWQTYGTIEAEPRLPLVEWAGIPLLFGEPRHEWINDGETLLLHADIIASTFYLISRYEEMYRRDERDKHGRFPGRASLPYRAGFIHRPIIDEYGEALRQLITEQGIVERLDIELSYPEPYFQKVNLTHDIDQPYLYRGLKGYIRSILDGGSPWTMVAKVFGSPRHDPYFTFHKLLEWNGTLRRKLPEGMVDTIFFVKTPDSHPLDKPNYRLRSRYMRLVVALARRAEVCWGLHCSYQSGLEPTGIASQREVLQRRLSIHIAKSRHHYLSLREPEDMLELLGAGIRHDYTMGYADVAGFRLGTCRPVRFINPNTRSLTELLIHPLTMMDVTLSRPDYMGLDHATAEAYASTLVQATARYGGELNLLWHNEQLSPNVHPWHTALYRSLLSLILEIERHDPRRMSTHTMALREVAEHHGCRTLDLGR